MNSDVESSSKLEDALIILDVGHGNCAVVLDTDEVVVVDTGPGASLDTFLTQQKIKHIDAVLISHADFDHIGGLVALLASKTVTIGKVRLNTDSAKASAAWDDLTFELSQSDSIDFQPSLTVHNSGEFSTTHVTIEIAAPNDYLASKGPGSKDRAQRTLDSNTLSAVIRLLFDGRPFALLPGDLDLVGLQNLMEDDQPIDAPIVIFPHHGGRPGNSNIQEFVSSFLGATSASTIVFSIGRGKHATPRPELVSAIRKHSSRLRIVCTQLSEHCAKQINDGVVSGHLHSVHAQGKTKSACCGGSLVYFFKAGKLQPDEESHQQFISLAADTPLCR